MNDMTDEVTDTHMHFHGGHVNTIAVLLTPSLECLGSGVVPMPH